MVNMNMVKKVMRKMEEPTKKENLAEAGTTAVAGTVVVAGTRTSARDKSKR